MKTQQIEFSGMELDQEDKEKGTRKIHGSATLLSPEGRTEIISLRIEDTAIQLELVDFLEKLANLGFVPRYG